MRVSTIIYTAKQGTSNITRNKMFSLASILTMSTCIFLFGLFFSVIVNFQSIVKSAEEGVAITVLFDEGITQEEIDEIGDQLSARDDVSSLDYTDAETAWEEFQIEYFGEDNLEMAEGFADDNPLANSASYAVYMYDVSTQDELVEFAEGIEGVRTVNKSDVVASTLTSINILIGYASAIIITILLLISIFLISNTVTIGINVRKEEIAIMKYIGAKDGFVRAPFIIEGVIIGLIGAVIPLSILYFCYETAISYIQTKFSLLNNILVFLPVQDVYEVLLPAGIALGVGIGFLGSTMTIRKHLKV
ncbi:MAG: permease-like cell division protein FtsX [Eubacteriales bacterium]